MKNSIYASIALVALANTGYANEKPTYGAEITLGFGEFSEVSNKEFTSLGFHGRYEFSNLDIIATGTLRKHREGIFTEDEEAFHLDAGYEFRDGWRIGAYMNSNRQQFFANNQMSEAKDRGISLRYTHDQISVGVFKGSAFDTSLGGVPLKLDTIGVFAESEFLDRVSVWGQFSRDSSEGMDVLDSASMGISLKISDSLSLTASINQKDYIPLFDFDSSSIGIRLSQKVNVLSTSTLVFAEAVKTKFDTLDYDIERYQVGITIPLGKSEHYNSGSLLTNHRVAPSSGVLASPTFLLK